MNNLKLVIFAFFMALIVAIIHFNKQDLIVLFAEPKGALSTRIIGDDFPFILYDQTGISFTLMKPPMRIASTTLMTDNILSVLVNQNRLVAVCNLVDNPQLSNIVNFYAKSIPRIRGEIESILSLQPDLIFISSFTSPDTVRYLLHSHIAVVRLSEFNSIADILNNIRLIGLVTNTQAKAKTLMTSLHNKLNELAKQVKNKPKFRVLYYDLNGYSVGKNSLMDESIRLAGGINVTSGILPEGENKISEELAVSLQPDVIILNQGGLNQSQEKSTAKTILKNKKAWENVPAIKNNRIYTVKSAWLTGISQVHINAIIAIAKLLHPRINIQFLAKTKKKDKHVQ
ncbi:MAG: ABC transporter substrate-binding protein [Psychromonas sp.]|nr:ABC transporter substrate-binding protein [Psychromonas sp.]